MRAAAGDDGQALRGDLKVEAGHAIAYLRLQAFAGCIEWPADDFADGARFNELGDFGIAHEAVFMQRRLPCNFADPEKDRAGLGAQLA